MTSIVSIIEAIKRTYLNSAADLAVLSMELSDQITLHGVPSDSCTEEELDELCRLLDIDTRKSSVRCREAARLQNKITPPPYKKETFVAPPYLRRVK